MSNLKPKIYVACLAAYNNGKLHGSWIDANQDIDLIWQEINKILAASPEPASEEWAIHDYEDFGEISISENQGIESVVELAKFIAEHGELGAKLLEHIGSHLDDAIQLLEENYHGEYKSEEDYAYALYEDCYEIPDYLVYYIDYEKLARDLFISDYFSIEVDGKVHVFSNL